MAAIFMSNLCQKSISTKLLRRPHCGMRNSYCVGFHFPFFCFCYNKCKDSEPQCHGAANLQSGCQPVTKSRRGALVDSLENQQCSMEESGSVIMLVRHWPWCTFTERGLLTAENEPTMHRTHRTHRTHIASDLAAGLCELCQFTARGYW